MYDGRAEIFDVVEAGFFGDPARLGRDNPELQPERSGPCFDRFPRVRRRLLRAAEDVDEIDRTVDLGERADARNAQHFVAARRPHRDHVVSLCQQVAHHPVARPVRLRRGTDEGDRLRVAQDVCRTTHPPKAILGSMVKAVIFDVDFTLARPGPELGAEGYRRVGERHGLTLDPDRYEEARLAALDRLQRHPDHVHDDELWIAFTEEIVRGMGGGDAGARACAEELVGAWEQHERFTLYEDSLPALAALREHGVKIGLISNGSRDLEEFVAHHGLDADCVVGSRAFGRTKPHPEIFRHALALLDVRPEDAVMIGDSYEDDIEGARSLGMKAFLLDRDDRRPDESDRLPDLFALPAALGLAAL